MHDILFKTFSIKCFNFVKKKICFCQPPRKHFSFLFFFPLCPFYFEESPAFWSEVFWGNPRFCKMYFCLDNQFFRQDSHTCCQERNEVVVYFYLWKTNVFSPLTGANFIIPEYYMMKKHLWITEQNNKIQKERMDLKNNFRYANGY